MVMVSLPEMSNNGKESPSSMAGIGCHERVRELVTRFLPQPASIADLAAGEGAFSLELQKLGHSVYAADASAENWRLPELPLHIHNFDSEFAETVLKHNNKFDGVAAIEIIEHLENPFRFVRECAKILKPGGLLFLTTPNVESVASRMIFLYSGRLSAFGAYETVRPAHITPLFRWKLEMILDEAGLEVMYEGYTRQNYATGINLKGRIAAVVGRVIEPFLKGETGGEGRIIVARRKN